MCLEFFASDRYGYIFSFLYSTIQFYQTVHIRPAQAETRKKSQHGEGHEDTKSFS